MCCPSAGSGRDGRGLRVCVRVFTRVVYIVAQLDDRHIGVVSVGKVGEARLVKVVSISLQLFQRRAQEHEHDIGLVAEDASTAAVLPCCAASLSFDFRSPRASKLVHRVLAVFCRKLFPCFPVDFAEIVQGIPALNRQQCLVLAHCKSQLLRVDAYMQGLSIFVRFVPEPVYHSRFI